LWLRSTLALQRPSSISGLLLPKSSGQHSSIEASSMVG
jgi:hypothetical protein